MLFSTIHVDSLNVKRLFFFSICYIHFEITGNPCNLTGSKPYLYEGPHSCSKLHPFLF